MKLLLTSLCFLFHIAGICQVKQLLQVGDTLPNYEVKMVADGKIVNIRDLVGKRNLILYFWGRRCLPCVRNLVKYDSIQKHFGNKVFILCVSAEKDTKEVKEFLDLRPRLGKSSLTFVTDGTWKMFKDLKSGSFGWFDKGAVLRVIATSAITTQQSVGDWLNRSTSNFTNRYYEANNQSY